MTEGLIWKNYQTIKQYFPSITLEKETFIKELSLLLPEVDVDIQSMDGLYIDILWNNVIFSITDKDNYAITYDGKFSFFKN